MSKKTKLPAPSFIDVKRKCLEGDIHIAREDAETKDGKIRTFPHVRGNWASFVYIPVEECDEIETLTSVIKNASEDLPVDSPLIHFDIDRHISLTRTQVLRHHWIDNFWLDLSQKLKHHDKFDLVLDTFQVYTNEEKTRTFIAIKVHHTENVLRLISDCDCCLLDYGLQKYYEDPSIHFSLAWISGDRSDWMKTKLLPLLNAKLEEIRDAESSLNFISVEKLEFKTGNKIYEFLL